MPTLPRRTESSSSGLSPLPNLAGFTSASPHQQALSPTSSVHGSHADLYSPNHLPIQHIRAEDKAGLHSRYDMGSKLGKGAFGTVRLVTDKATREVFACKSIHKRSKNGASIDQIGREVEIMKKIRHRHVVQLREVYETPQKVYIVMEYCNGGELVKKVQKNGSIDETDLKLVIKRLASVIGYLHDLGIVHRDIKPENILLSTQDPADPYNIKVSDFGLAAFSGGGKLMENVCGTPLYMAPEVLAGLGYSQQCDIWSIGVMMALLLCNYTRAAEHGLRDMIQRGQVDMSHELWADCPPSAKNLIEKMLQVDPAQRIAAKEILLHPWITGDKLESQTVLEMMRSYRAEQRWKKTIYVVIAAQRFLAGIDQHLILAPVPVSPSRSASVEPSDLASQRRGDSPLGSSTLHSIIATSAYPPTYNSGTNHIPATSHALGPRLRHRNESSSSPSLPISPHDSTDNMPSTLNHTQPNPGNTTILATGGGGSGHAGQTLLANQMSALQMIPGAVRRSSLQGTKRRPLAPIPTSTSALHAGQSPPQSTSAVNSAGGVAGGGIGVGKASSRHRFQSN
ncbi:kinase-like domain-containing protein [Catenaria anguillulae PL171]|uniref:Kinase-like domain-containing protein n=1 Tax=Catenaria anguillulae PL171 TaxID=765915 RepID=A0A1Y2HQ64_9FUNG|nr:kinase-like domain-containing protein [Catenaria anguillulae PL171]